MSEFEKIHLGYIAGTGVYFEIEENQLLIEFEEKLRESDYVLVDKKMAEAMFTKRSLFEAFARKYGFVTHWDHYQYIFVCSKEPPWIE